MTIKLYTLIGRDTERHFSPHVWKAEMALAHKGPNYERVGKNFVDIPHIEGGAKIVPVIRDGEAVVADSFKIAQYLDEQYPSDTPLLGDAQAQAHARFIERWSQLTIHPFVARWALVDIHDCLNEENKSYFKADREKRFGMTMEAFIADREERLQPFLASLQPIRATLGYQPWLGGETPSFADYIVFGAFQWLRIISGTEMLPKEDVVVEWFERCLDLYDGLGRSVSAGA